MSVMVASGGPSSRNPRNASHAARAERNCWPESRLGLPSLWRIRQLGQDALHALDDDLLLLQLVESGFATEFGGEQNGTPKGELADDFALQQGPGSQAACSSYAAGSYLIALRDLFFRSRLRLGLNRRFVPAALIRLPYPLPGG